MVAPVKNFRDLQVWNKAHQLTLKSYMATQIFPKQELYGLTSQIRRCASSIAANIAEGCGKRGNAEFGRFLSIATGSASELEYHFLLAHDLHLLSDDDFNELHRDTVEVKRMLASLIQKVEAERTIALTSHQMAEMLNADC
jgi:four helix bundle protein